MFQSNWQEVAHRRYLYVHPIKEVRDDDWVKFFKENLPKGDDKEFRVLLDARNSVEEITLEGFSQIVSEIQGRGLERVYLAVLPANDSYILLAALLDTVARNQGLEVEVKIFDSLEGAQLWLVQ